ncbi:MAG TPA: GNAT family N-acetyltransferase [Flavipsychrobacter sp.]|nr:GNAT family N-acetyltransferase [Flavipsychrobacter sp.]
MRHCKKHKDFQVKIYRQAAQLPKIWDDLLPQSHFLNVAQLGIYERINLPDISFVYALIFQGEKPLGAAYFQVLSIKEKHLHTAVLKQWQQKAWKGFTNLGSPRLLVAGHLFRHDICSFYWDENVADFDAYKMYQVAIKKAMKSAHAHAVLVKDVNETLIPYFQHYAPEYILLRNDISMEMDVQEEWETIKNYEQSLKHKYAQRFRKVRQPWEQLEVAELSNEETEQQKHVLYNLYQQVSARQQVRLGILSEDFLPELKANNSNLRIWLAKHNDIPVAFFSAWTHNGAFDMFYIGFDYAKNEELQLYFNILFFAVEQAIILKKQKLILGRTALEAKARLGCKPKYLSTYLYIRNPILRNVITRLQTNINSMEGEWENRHPFKK